jgi:hypothetical protein
MPPITRSFWSLVEKTDACWLWSGAKEPRGYGYVYQHGKKRRAHRITYELFKGPIPDGLDIDHLCRNTSCVNPEHLEAVSHRVNVLRGQGPTAENAKKLTCIRGHPLTQRRTIPNARRCNACRRQDPDAPIRETCLRCSGLIPAGSKANRLYCSDRCRARAADARYRARRAA